MIIRVQRAGPDRPLRAVMTCRWIADKRRDGGETSEEPPHSSCAESLRDGSYIPSVNEEQSGDPTRTCVEFRGRSSTKTQPDRLSLFGHRTGWTNGKTMVGGI